MAATIECVFPTRVAATLAVVNIALPAPRSKTCTRPRRPSACPTAGRRWQAWWCVCLPACVPAGWLAAAAGATAEACMARRAAAGCSPPPRSERQQPASCHASSLPPTVRPHPRRCGRGCTATPVARPPTRTATLSTFTTHRWGDVPDGWLVGGRGVTACACMLRMACKPLAHPWQA